MLLHKQWHIHEETEESDKIWCIKDLRREDSDGVWNELAYYKQQTTNLTQEKSVIGKKKEWLL